MTLTEPTTAARTADTLLPHVTVLVDRCAGCEECVVRCPTGALSIDEEDWVVSADDAACVGCRQCVRTCPFSAIEVAGPVLAGERVATLEHHPVAVRGDRSEVRIGITSWEEAIAEASRCLACPDPTCVRGCPAHNDIPGFLAALRSGDLEEAHGILRRTSVLPDVCSRVCDQALQCEGACSWSLAGERPVAIGLLERFIADHAPVPPPARRSDRGVGLEVAVVGSGPAGIAATAELVEAGARVTVFEKDDEPGGLLAWGIPDFTLPAPVKARPWQHLVASGVDLRLGVEVDFATLDALAESYDAVVVATGAGDPLRLPVPGDDLEGIWDATRFLVQGRKALGARGDLVTMGAVPEERARGRAPFVLVVGAGNTAMDVARTVRRLGGEAVCVDWLAREYAPVRPDELAEAEAEGVRVRFSTTLARLEGEEGRVARATLVATRQRSATARPEVVAPIDPPLEVDLVVMAMGYRLPRALLSAFPGLPVRKSVPALADRRFLGSGLLQGGAPAFARHQPVGRLALGREHATGLAMLGRRERVWVVGDALIGPATVVEAMAHGREAARTILARRPRRPASLAPVGKAFGVGASLERVLIAYESRGGFTAARAGEVADALRARGVEVRVLALAEVGARDLAWAQLLLVATWVEGLVVAAVRAARATRRWVAALPPLAGLPVGILCTYAVSPRGAVEDLGAQLAARGATVVAGATYGNRERPTAWAETTDAFVASLVESGARPEPTPARRAG